MLGLVHGVVLAIVTPRRVTANLVFPDVAESLAAQELVLNLMIGRGPVPARMITAHVVGVFVDDRKMPED
jgi:hypothetical protein